MISTKPQLWVETGNYTASLVANYINAEELQNFTHVDGIYTANPELVLDAKRLNPCLIAKQMKFFGATILNAKTIMLLEKNIPSEF
jgi:aspartokinase